MGAMAAHSSRSPAGSIGAAYAVRTDETRVAVEIHGPALRSASILKPLVFWVAADRMAHEQWVALAQRGIVASDNDATVAIWDEALLDVLAERVGERWPIDPGGLRTFGRVLVTAQDVATGYAALVAAADASDRTALDVLGWMRAVPERQTFGLRGVVAATLGVDQSNIGVKCGWYGYPDEGALRTHGVTVTPTGDGWMVTAVLTSLGYPAAAYAAYLDRYDRTGGDVCEVHERLAGSLLRDATRRLAEQVTKRQPRPPV